MPIESSTPDNTQPSPSDETQLEYPPVSDLQSLIDDLQAVVDGMAHPKDFEFVCASEIYETPCKISAWISEVFNVTHVRGITAFETVADIVAWAEEIWADIAQDEDFSDKDFLVEDVDFRGKRLIITFMHSECAFVTVEPSKGSDYFSMCGPDETRDWFLERFGPGTVEPQSIDPDAVAEREQLGAPQMSNSFASVDAPVRAKFTPRHGTVSIGRQSGPSVVIPDVVDVHSLIDDLQTAVREMARHQEAEATA
ncbi:hypothetical protein [Rhodococcus sp. UFZ-B548]|uniref:hypothetical protein n=1 Tax=Rhodococcus sp. UFZ-B548 TaxID=2742212 RepID=UPI0015F784B3|nr:hypothetical protein [Rhodococcus sp. UFZ-B548]